MEKRIIFWAVCLMFFVAGATAQDAPAGLVTAFKKGDSKELGKFLGNKVELIIKNKTSSLDKAGAEKEMGKFFAENPVKGFTVNHEGKRNESSFIIGTLSTSNGNFRINCFFKKVQDNYLIHQIRIDTVNE